MTISFLYLQGDTEGQPCKVTLYRFSIRVN